MMKHTAIALGLAMATSVGLAAQGNTSAQVGVNAGAGASGGTARIDTDAAAQTRFDALDRNGDGLLSRAEASASDTVSRLYESLNTRDTIENEAKKARPAGITRAQFQAGMQARQSGSGSVGPAVSGGQTYTLMRDGTRKLKDAASATQSRSADAVNGAVTGVTGAADTGARTQTRADAGTEAATQRQRAQDKARSLQDRARGGVGQARSEAEIQRDRARDDASRMQERARGQTSQAYGQSRSRVEDSVPSHGSRKPTQDPRAGAEVHGRTNTRIHSN